MKMKSNISSVFDRFTGTNEPWRAGKIVASPSQDEIAHTHAGQIVDTCVGQAMQLAHQWRFGCIVLAVATAGTSFGWWHEAQKPAVQPVALVFDQYGTPSKIFIPADFTPTEAMKIAFIKRWVTDAFRKSPDQRVNIERREWLIYATGGKANDQYEPWFRQNIANAHERRVRIVSVKPTANPMLFDVTWDERNVEKSGIEGPWQRFNGDFALVYRQQKTNEEIAQNEFGLHVVNITRNPVNEVVR